MDTNKMRDLKALAEAAHADLPDWQPGFGLTDPQKDFSMQAGPAVVLSLLAEIERLQGFVLRRREKEVEYDDALCKVANQRDQLKAENEDYKSGQERYEQIIEDLKAENEALRKHIQEGIGLMPLGTAKRAAWVVGALGSTPMDKEAK